MKSPKILVLSGSIRSGSVNTRLQGAISKQLSIIDCDVTRTSLEDYPLPLYNGDLEASNGAPENAERLARLFDAQDGLFFVGPEYNGSISPLLKNTIDWITRVKEVDGQKVSPFRGKVAAIAACSPGSMGGITMLGHLRDVLFRLGTLVISEQLAVGNAGSAFDEDDKLTNERAAGLLISACDSLKTKAALLKLEA